MTGAELLAATRKALAATVGVAAEAVAGGFLHGNAETIAQGLIALATVLGVYRVPNTPPAGAPSNTPGVVPGDGDGGN